VGDDAVALLDDADVVFDGGDELPERGEFLALIGAPEGRATALLRVLLGRCRAGAPIVDQLAVIVDLGRFVVAGPGVPGSSETQALARLELLVLALEKVPAAQRRFCASIHAVLGATRAVKLFGEIGLPNDRGLLAETTDRLARAVLPEPPAINEMWRLASHIFREPKDLEWLGPAADPLLNRLAAAGGEAWAPLQVQVLDAISVITTRIAALGMSEAMRVRMIETTVRDSPLYILTRSDPGTMTLLI
jgi:site-specific recombinase